MCTSCRHLETLLAATPLSPSPWPLPHRSLTAKSAFGERYKQRQRQRGAVAGTPRCRARLIKCTHVHTHPHKCASKK